LFDLSRRSRTNAIRWVRSPRRAKLGDAFLEVGCRDRAVVGEALSDTFPVICPRATARITNGERFKCFEVVSACGRRHHYSPSTL